MFLGIFAAVMNICTSVFQEEDDVLNPFRQTVRAEQLIQDVVGHRSHAVTVNTP